MRSHSNGDANDPDQLHIEARVFWEGNGTEIRHMNDMRAILWAHHGEQISFRSRSLFPTNALHLNAPNLHELRIALTTHVRQAMEMCEMMRETAAMVYSGHTGRFWQSHSGSRLQHAHNKTSASIDGEAFLAARREKRQMARTPVGTPIVFAGGRVKIAADDAGTFANNLFGLLDKLKNRVPDMVLVHGGDTQGLDRFAASWAASRNVQQVTFGLRRALGQRAGFYRNQQFLDMKPKCVIALEGSGVLQRLVEDAKQRNILVIDRRGPLCTQPAKTHSKAA